MVLGFIKSHPEHKLELPIWNGQTADLSGADLSNIDLQNASLPSVNLENTVLRATNLRGALLTYANLQDAFLEGADLQEANLMYAILQGSNLKNSNLEGADLKYADLNKAHLENANLKRAKLLEVKLQGADLQGADLQEASLMGAKLNNCHLNRANLQRAHFEEAKLEGADLGGADARFAYFYAANLRKAKLIMANFQGAQLNGADLQECDVMAARFQNVSFVDAKLQGLDLTSVQSLSNIYLNDAWLDRTRLRREQLGGCIEEEKNGDYSAAKRGYLILKQNFDDLGDYEASSWAYRKERKMEKLEAREIGRAAFEKRERRLPKLPWDGIVHKERDLKGVTTGYAKYVSDTLVEWLCDYGESAGRVIVWIVLLLFVIGPLLFSSLGGVKWSKELGQEYFSLTSLGKLWFLCVHYFLYSLDVFTTASFSGLEPINNAVKIASGFFAITGIFLAGLLGFVAGNRIRRS